MPCCERLLRMRAETDPSHRQCFRLAYQNDRKLSGIPGFRLFFGRFMICCVGLSDDLGVKPRRTALPGAACLDSWLDIIHWLVKISQMARQIEYDPKALRQNLLSVFWGNGYAETSLSDLEQATGLNRRQLYNGPGDKKAMFLQALDDFDETAGQQFLQKLESPDAGLADIDWLFCTFLELARSGEGPGGCLVCSTSQEDIAADSDVHGKISAYFDRIHNAYANALARASDRGEVSLAAEEIERKAALLFGVHVGFCILARAGADLNILERMAAEASAIAV